MDSRAGDREEGERRKETVSYPYSNDAAAAATALELDTDGTVRWFKLREGTNADRQAEAYSINQETSIKKKRKQSGADERAITVVTKLASGKKFRLESRPPLGGSTPYSTVAIVCDCDENKLNVG